MEKTFTIIDTRSSSKKVYNSTATTLGELKAELASMGFATDNILVQEALTKTEFLDDASILPTDVEYKGAKTNNLIFRITLNEKKITSGMTRPEIYIYIKENPELKRMIEHLTNKNFTNVATTILDDIVSDFLDTVGKHEEPKEPKEPKAECKCDCQKDDKLDKIVAKIDALQKELLDLRKELEEAANTENSPYSDDELEEILNF